jgi:hypothetical protein
MCRNSNWLALSAGVLLLVAAPAWAGWRQDIGDVRLSGFGTARWFGIPLYEARLWAGNPPSTTQPFALELRYLTTIRREVLVATSIREMERIAGPVEPSMRSRWVAEMSRAFMDVSRGDRIVGVFTPERGVTFYGNDRRTALVDDARFAALFAAIWLSPQARDPRLRAELLAEIPVLEGNK